MRQYQCDTCKNIFSPEYPGKPSCPACGSKYVSEIRDPDEPVFWKSYGFIISAALIVIMFIVLLLLPEYPRIYQVCAVQKPEQCSIKFTITQGKKMMNFDEFKCSLDSGKTWNDRNEFIIRTQGVLMVEMKSKKSGNSEFRYLFSNPILFKPSCEDPCDCRKLQVISAGIENISNQKKFVIHASLPKCPKEYSVTGENGTFKKDSIFSLGNTMEFSIFVKNDKCQPVAYSKNPYRIATQPEVMPTSAERIYDEKDVDDKPYLLQYKEKSDLEKYLREQLSGSIKGRLTITLVVSTSGNPTNIRSAPYNAAVKDIIENLGSWWTGYKEGKAVNTRVTLIVSF